MEKILLVVGVFLFVGGCNTAPVARAPVVRAPNVNGSGLLFEDARQKYRRPCKHDPEEVRALLGEPDEAESGTFGSATANPWIGVMWMYEWQQNPNVPNGYHRIDGGWDGVRLRIMFERSRNGWVVNGWNWLPE